MKTKIKVRLLFLSVLLLLFAGCEKKQVNPTFAFLVLNEVPEAISAVHFNGYLLAKNCLTAQETKLLKDAFRQSGNEFVRNDGPDAKDAAGKSNVKIDKNDVLRILRKAQFVPSFSNASLSEPGAVFPEWTEIACLDVDNGKRETFKKDGRDAIREWHRVRDNSHDWWVLSEELVFKTVEETEGVLLKGTDIFKTPVYNITNRVGYFERGVRVKSRGYSYPERSFKNTYINVEVYDKTGWCPVESVVLNARPGVMKRDEVLFDNPEDLKANLNPNRVYEKLDIVPVIENRKDGWLKVVIDEKDRFYYIKNGKDAVSDDPVDIAFASYVRDDYKKAKAIAGEFNLALNSKVKSLGKISNAREKLQAIDTIRSRLEKYIGNPEYANSSFVKSNSQDSLGQFVQELFELVNESEYLLGSSKSSETKIESKKGVSPVDSADESENSTLK
jgi:hypothetical protein